MRPYFICGNWKMHKTDAEARVFVESYYKKAGTIGLPQTVELAVCPQAVSFFALKTLSIEFVAKFPQVSPLSIGLQNTHWETQGAYTGEHSPLLAKELGAKYVILGHSERRQYFGETNETAAKRVIAALEAGICPIFCVGETLEQREAGATEAVIDEQIRALFQLLSKAPRRIVFAYEPVWAIGTGKVATVEQAEFVHAHIRNLIASHWGEQAAEQIQIQYGGSVKPGNASELLASPNIDGALVGGASLDVDSLLAIAAAIK